MLRLLVLLLLIGNLLFWSWTRGWLDGVVGTGPEADREPQRMAAQVRPESLRLLGPAAASAAATAAAASAAADAASAAASDAASSPASAGAGSLPVPASAPAVAPTAAGPVVCLEGGPWTGADGQRAETLVREVLPAGAWTRSERERSGLWVVYMGKFPNAEALERKRDELRRLGVESAPVRGLPELEPGLSLGRFEVEANANAELVRLARLGVRTARVATVRTALQQITLRVERADAETQRRLAGLRGKLPAERAFTPCPA